MVRVGLLVRMKAETGREMDGMETTTDVIEVTRSLRPELAQS